MGKLDTIREKKKNEEREGNVKKCKAQYYLYA